MRDFFRRKGVSGEEPQDFVLFNSEEEPFEDFEDSSADTADGLGSDIQHDFNVDNAASAEEIGNTIAIDTREINTAFAEQETTVFPPIPSVGKRTRVYDSFLISYITSHKIFSMAIGAVLVAAIISLSAIGIIKFKNPLHGYAQTAAEKGNIMRTMDTEGTLAIGDKYEVTSLVAGRIISSGVEVGDTVDAGDILYQLDDTEAKLAVERAKNEVDRAQDTTASAASSVSRILASESGVVQSISIKTGSHVYIGMQVGTIRKSDGTVAPITAYMSGTVVVVSVSAGQSLSAGQVIATIRNSDSSNDERNKTYDKKSTEIDLQSAQRQLENYTIKAPVSGVVAEKNSRVGDNVGITDSGKPMMVIVDTSKLTFTFSVDEYRLREIERGQSVVVNVDSIPDAAFSGEITSISSEGKAGEDGKTMFDITVTISETGDLKAGMNVKAKVVLASVNNALYVPQNALMETDGQNALVFVKSKVGENGGDTQADESLENKLNYPWIKVPKGCDLISVKYGISDGMSVQILSGLKSGDIVVYNPEGNGSFIESTAKADEGKSDKESKSRGGSVSVDGFSTDNDSVDDSTKQELENKIDSILNDMEIGNI